MSYNVTAVLTDENGNNVNQSIIIHNEMEGGMPVGRLITRNAFVNLVKNYVDNSTSPNDTIVAFRINRQILQLMLSFEDCASIAFCKSQRSDGAETMTAIALNAQRKPLGWNPPIVGSNYEANKFIAAEWIHGVSKLEAKDSFYNNPNPLHPELVNVEKFLSIL